MSRTFTAFADNNPVARCLVDELPRLKGDILGYQRKMRELGAHLANSMLPQLKAELGRDVCIICTVEDADFLARGLIEELESHGLESSTRMICMWNKRVRRGEISISPVLRSYEEKFDKSNAIFIVVKSIISGACVVRTNLTKAISTANPVRIFVAAPVMLVGAESRLACEFPEEVSSRFEFIHFATDTEKSSDGESVFPGVGGSVYELLGLGNEADKNKYVPEIVRERRRKAFPSLQPA